MMITQSFKKIEDLELFLNLSQCEKKIIEQIIKKYPMLVSKYYLNLIDWNDKNDPIRNMVIPSVDEESANGLYDTSGELFNTRMKGLQHKYPQTVLILVTNKCLTYCRHCFRKRLVGRKDDEIAENWEGITEYIRSHKEISNVILSGGDPLSLSTKKIMYYLKMLSDIEQIKYIRIGTRVPVVCPDRITNDIELLDILKDYSKSPKKLVFSTQFNHTNELTDHSIAAIDKLLTAGTQINNQTVLLKNVNDNPFVMATLQKRINGAGIIPYYVFQCRPVKRVKNIFQVPLTKGIAIIEEAKSMVDGLAKRFKFVMSHETGKIEILGMHESNIYFKYHETGKQENQGKIIIKAIDDECCWI